MNFTESFLMMVMITGPSLLQVLYWLFLDNFQK